MNVISPIPTKSRPFRSMLGICSPAILAAIASLWPLERITLLLVCALLGFGAFIILINVRSRAYLVAAIATFLIVVSVAISNWPLRAAYVLSRPSFNRVAEQVRAGEAPITPCLVGLFRVRKAELHNGRVCLWTDNRPAGSTGFAQTGSAGQDFNLWSDIPLDSSWHFISED